MILEEIGGVLDGTGESSFAHRCEDFLFRFASGGSLVVVLLEGWHYYCLSWLDVDPVGWNLANGGSGNRQGLRNPDLNINAEDQGIEIDRIAQMRVPEESVSCDSDYGKSIDRVLPARKP